MHKTSLITAIALLIFICSCRQRPPVSPGSPQTYLIPEAGIQVEFPGQPQFGPVPTYSAYFSETRSYDCMQPYRQDTVPYGTHVGVYYNKVSSGSPEVLDDGLKAMREMIYNTQKATVLVNEKIQFLGLPAHRMRIHVEASQPFYVSVIMIARGPYCVELSTFEGAAPGVKESIWKNHSFFQTVSFTDPVPLSVMLEPREGGANCRLFPCYLKEQQIIAWFPEAPSIKRAEVKPGLNGN